MQEYAIGQRWLSDTETELGLGVLIEVGDRTITILFPASDETCVYVKASAPLSRIIFSVGDSVTDQDGQQWLVNKVSLESGLARYHCVAMQLENDVLVATGDDKVLAETRLNAHVTLSRPLERLLACRVENKEWYDLRIESLLTATKQLTSPLRGITGPRVGLVPHQLYIAHEVGRRLAPRVLLADEVGLGKTIEAGLIIHQQLFTGRSERVLILVPDSLQYQWMIEMRRRFNLDFALYDLVRTASIKEHSPEANPFLEASRIIASRDLLVDHADLMSDALAAGFDLLVVDEAHSLQWSEIEGGNDHYQLVETLAAQTQGVLLLTATPEQMGLSSHFARLRLLDPTRFHSLDTFLQEEEQYTHIAKLAEVLIDNAPISLAQWQQIQAVIGDQAPSEDTPENRQRLLTQLLDRHGTGRVLFRNTRDAIEGFQGRDCHPVMLPRPEGWVSSGSMREQLWPEESQLDGEWMQNDPRVAWLMNVLRKDLKLKKVLLIARSGPVVAALDTALRMHAGIRSVVFNEDMSLLERDQAAAYFAEENNGAQILLCSEIGSEGRNFQFASDLILFDLPANPDTLEQRIGRLDRIGQRNRIQIHVPFVQNSAGERLFRWYHEALNVFSQISPSAQTLHEHYLPQLKGYLLGEQTDGFDQLLAQVSEQCEALQLEMQAGRDRLLEYNSCRPHVAARIVRALEEQDANSYLKDYLTRFMSATNIEYEEQYDGSVIVRPSSDILVDGLDIPEDSMTMIFDRERALVREDAEYMTFEHPFVSSVLEVVQSQAFGNNTVCFLRSNAIPANTILIEAWFRVQVLAPKALNLPASLPQQMIRVLLHEGGQELSAKIGLGLLDPYIVPMDKNQTRTVVKLKRDAITAMYNKAEGIANAKLPEFKALASTRFSERLTQEVNRLSYLQKQHGAVRDTEIELLKHQISQGLKLLDQTTVSPEAIRVLVAVK